MMRAQRSASPSTIRGDNHCVCRGWVSTLCMKDVQDIAAVVDGECRGGLRRAALSVETTGSSARSQLHHSGTIKRFDVL